MTQLYWGTEESQDYGYKNVLDVRSLLTGQPFSSVCQDLILGMYCKLEDLLLNHVTYSQIICIASKVLSIPRSVLQFVY